MKSLSAILLCLLSVGSLRAQDTLAHSLLWEISGNGLTQPSYLYGTIHIIAEDDFFLTDATKAAFEQSQQLALEIDLDEMNNPMAMIGMMGSLMMNGGTTLKDLLPKEDYAIVKAYLRDSLEMGMMAGMMERMKPMFLSEMVGMDMNAMQNPAEAQSGTTSYEMVFAEMAAEQEIEMLGLETMEFQIGLFDSIPYQAQADMLLESIKSGGKQESDMLDQLVTRYKAQDLDGLNDLLNADESSSQYYDILLVKRNLNWIPKIGELARQKPTFFAVGAGHLPGDQGVIRLLRQAGYTLTPLY